MSVQAAIDDLKLVVGRVEREAKWSSHAAFQLLNYLTVKHQEARLAKRYQESDEIRTILSHVGVIIDQGTVGYAYDDIPQTLRGRQLYDTWRLK